MKFSHAFLSLGIAVCLNAQTPPKPLQTPAPQSTPVPPDGKPIPVPHVEMKMENPSDVVMPVVPPDTVVLSVGDVKVTAAQFDQIIEGLPDPYKGIARGAGRKKFGDNLVQMLVLAQEAKRRKLDQTPVFQTQAQFQMNNVLATAMYQQLAKDTVPDDETLRKYWADHKSEFEQISARHILIRFQGSPVPVKPGQKDLTAEEALTKAQEIEAKLKAGGDFQKLAEEYSDDTGNAFKGGDLGYFHHGQMVPSFDEAAFTLKVGEISEPVRSQFGYHVIKVDAVKSFDDVKPEVIKQISPELSKKALDDLEKNAAVVYNTDFFTMAKQ